MAMVNGSGHYEPRTYGRLNPFHAHFLGCHVVSLKGSCEKIYGDGADTLCKANEMHICEINRSNAMVRTRSAFVERPPAECNECFTKKCHLHQNMTVCESCVREQNCRCKKSCGLYQLEDSVAYFCKQHKSVIV